MGKLCKCPRCKHSVRVPLPEVSESESMQLDEPPDKKVDVHAPEPLPKIHPPERLSAPNRYVICDHRKIVAVWSARGQGWKVRTNSGYVSPLTHRDLLPIEGDFRFVEIEVQAEGIEMRLRGLRVFELAKRHALLNLDRGDNDVLKSITGRGALNREHKHFVRTAIKEQLMPEVWSGAKKVLEFLGDTDYHSSEIREEA